MVAFQDEETHLFRPRQKPQEVLGSNGLVALLVPAPRIKLIQTHARIRRASIWMAAPAKEFAG